MRISGIPILEAGGGNSGIGNGVASMYPLWDEQLADEEKTDTLVTIVFGDENMIQDGIFGSAVTADSDDFVRNRAEAIGYIAERYFEHPVAWCPEIPSALWLKAGQQTLDGYTKQINGGYDRGNERTGQDFSPTMFSPKILK